MTKYPRRGRWNYMVRFATIIRWTPQTARAVDEQWNTVVKGTAPKAVIDAFGKIKIIAFESSLASHLAVLVYEVEEKDIFDAFIVYRYMQGVCTFETYWTISFDEFLKVREALPTEDIPKATYE